MIMEIERAYQAVRRRMRDQGALGSDWEVTFNTLRCSISPTSCVWYRPCWLISRAAFSDTASYFVNFRQIEAMKMREKTACFYALFPSLLSILLSHYSERLAPGTNPIIQLACREPAPF